MSIIQASITDEEEKLIMDYIKHKNISISDLIRDAVMEKIEDEIDLRLYEEAYIEYEKNPITYTFDEVRKD